MKRFLNTEFFRMVREASQTGVVANEDAMQREYDNFAALLLTEGKADCRNALAYVRAELSGLTANKKTVGADAYLLKALSLVERQIEWAEKCALAELTTTNCPHPRTNGNTSKLKWTANKTDLIELLYALNTACCFNHGNASLNRIAMFLGGAFGIDLSNFPRDFYDMRTRNNQLSFIISVCFANPT